MKRFLSALTIGFIAWLPIKTYLSPDFPWGNIYVENFEGEVMRLGEVSYHFNSEDDCYISYENYDFEKKGFYYKFSDGSSPKRLYFTDIKYHPIPRVLSAVCDFTKNGMDYLNVYYDQYTYDNLENFSRENGYQLDVNSYKESFPFDLSNGAKLTIKARSTNSLDSVPTDLIISFDKLAHPQNESLYETDRIRLNNEINTYEISIPKLYAESGIGSISMYILNKKTSLSIEKIVLEYEKIGKRVSEELIFSDAFGEAVLYDPYNDKDLKWVYRFKFNKDFTKIDNGELVIHSKDCEPWTFGKYNSNWFYSKFDNDSTESVDSDDDADDNASKLGRQ